MPCMDGGPTREELERERADFETITRLACDRCQELEGSGDPIPPWAASWWARHKVADARRARRQEAIQRDQEAREAALAKLTPQERAALGFRRDPWTAAPSSKPCQ